MNPPSEKTRSTWFVIELRHFTRDSTGPQIEGYVAVNTNGLIPAFKQAILPHLDAIYDREPIESFQPTIDYRPDLPEDGPVYVTRGLAHRITWGTHIIMGMMEYCDEMDIREKIGRSYPVHNYRSASEDDIIYALSQLAEWDESDLTIPSDRADTEGYAAITDY